MATLLFRERLSTKQLVNMMHDAPPNLANIIHQVLRRQEETSPEATETDVFCEGVQHETGLIAVTLVFPAGIKIAD